MSVKNLQASITDHLLAQGIAEESAAALAEIILTHVLSWSDADPADAESANAILAFSFGHRISSNGNRTPGPINHELAAIVKRHYEAKPRPIFAQWEIAEPLIAQGVPVQAIYPSIHRDSAVEVQYLNTEGVLDEALRLGLSDYPVLVIAHRHHVVRCATLIRQRNLTVVIRPQEMPSICDPESGQLWTAGKLTNLISEIISRLSAYREHELYERHPIP